LGLWFGGAALASETETNTAGLHRSLNPGLDLLPTRKAHGLKVSIEPTGRQRFEAIIVTLGPTVFDPSVLAIHEPGFSQTLEELVHGVRRHVVR
jgi:hypothetical protein